MAHAEKCLLCNGEGTKGGVPRDAGACQEICHGCGGYGWVTVGDKEDWNFNYYPPVRNRPRHLGP